jgi:hypothetical protein
LEENRPLAEGVQRKFEEREWLMGIFRISLMQGGENKECRKGRFQEPLGEKSSEIIKSG